MGSRLSLAADDASIFVRKKHFLEKAASAHALKTMINWLNPLKPCAEPRETGGAPEEHRKDALSTIARMLVDVGKR